MDALLALCAVGDRAERTYNNIVDIVCEGLESGGYDAIQLHPLAKQARVSLSTIYKLFGTRNELIVAALERWMETHTYSDATAPGPDATLYDVATWTFGQLFEPWERSPWMLEAYYRARQGQGGHKLDRQGLQAFFQMAKTILDELDPDYAADYQLIINSVVEALVARFAAGELAIGEILPALQRTVFRLTSDNAALARNRVSEFR
jgi:AcrR family transcriptional regulator